MSYTLEDIDLGVVTSEDISKDAQLFQMPIPTRDSDELLALDLFGAVRTINIKGVYSGSSSAIASFLGDLNDLINGRQSTRTYHSDTLGSGSSGNIEVFVQTIRHSFEKGSPNMVNYEISMLEAAESINTIPTPP